MLDAIYLEEPYTAHVRAWQQHRMLYGSYTPLILVEPRSWGFRVL